MIKIALIVGHSADRQGASKHGISEYVFWNQFLIDLMERLPQYEDTELKLFRRPLQKKTGYKEAVRILHTLVDDWGATYDVEFHFNGFSGIAHGHEVIHSGSVLSERLAVKLDECFDKHMNNLDRGVKRVVTRGRYQLIVGKSASIISEAFFGRSVLYFMEGDRREALFQVYLDLIEELSKDDL